MRRLVTLGLLSMAAALTTACGDDESGNGNGGSGGGSSGSGGNGGGNNGGSSNGGSGGGNNGGSGGANGGSGGSSNGGSGGGNNGGSGSDPDAGDGGGGPPCTGCLELRVPVAVANDDRTTLFQFSLGDAPLDMSTAVITYRIRALTIDNQIQASPFAQDADFGGFESRFFNLDAGNGFTSTDVFVNVEHNLANRAPVNTVFVPNADAGDAGGDAGGTLVPVAGDFDKSRVIQFGLNVGTAGAFTAVPVTVTVLVDSITFDGIDRPDVTFDDSAEGFAASGFQPQPGTELLHHPAD